MYQISELYTKILFTATKDYISKRAVSIHHSGISKQLFPFLIYRIKLKKPRLFVETTHFFLFLQSSSGGFNLSFSTHCSTNRFACNFLSSSADFNLCNCFFRFTLVLFVNYYFLIFCIFSYYTSNFNNYPVAVVSRTFYINYYCRKSEDLLQPVLRTEPPHASMKQVFYKVKNLHLILIYSEHKPITK